MWACWRHVRIDPALVYHNRDILGEAALSRAIERPRE
jgi:hypothetical protein